MKTRVTARLILAGAAAASRRDSAILGEMPESDPDKDQEAAAVLARGAAISSRAAARDLGKQTTRERTKDYNGAAAMKPADAPLTLEEMRAGFQSMKSSLS